VPGRHHADPIAARARAPASLIANAFTIAALSCMLKSSTHPAASLGMKASSRLARDIRSKDRELKCPA
jgi:hypothetical protein